MAKLIKSSGLKKIVRPENGSTFTLKELQEYVGGYIELVFLDDGKIFVVDEEGKLKGKEVNIEATIYARMKKAGFGNDFIVGDVLLCNKKEIE